MMRKLSRTEFTQHKAKNALFFHDSTVFTGTNQTSPFIPFQDGLDCFAGHIREVFFFQNRLLVEVSLSEHPNLRSFCAKSFLSGLTDDDVNLMLQAIQWLSWHRRHNYCSNCGSAIDLVQNACEKKCHTCHLSFFPSLSPAIMVLVKKDTQILLARSAHFRPGIYSALAGFVDIGETAEDAAHREVQEEVGLQITSLTYFGSQSWPFPGSFMIAFTADYLDGEIITDPHEIESAQWFNYHNVPKLPPMPSISRRLINATLTEYQNN